MAMPTEQEFIKNITELKETGIMQGGYLSEEQIEEVFPALTQEQRSLLLDFFKENHIGIGEALPDEELLDGEEESRFLQMYLPEPALHGSSGTVTASRQSPEEGAGCSPDSVSSFPPKNSCSFLNPHLK